jgi:hypothetical protein
MNYRKALKNDSNKGPLDHMLIEVGICWTLYVRCDAIWAAVASQAQATHRMWSMLSQRRNTDREVGSPATDQARLIVPRLL